MSAPTLLVGLGGTGSKIVCRVSRLVTKEQRKNLCVCAMDTDANELRQIENEFPFARTIQTSNNATVGEYLYDDAYAREQWFPVNNIINNKNLTQGAGQVRAISRLSFETCIRDNKMEPLHDAIKQLHKLTGNSLKESMRVIVVSSLAGGTGSGMLLPVSLYIRHHLEQQYRDKSAIIRGFFILPEVFYEVIKSPTQRDNLRCNAYAALRELDAFLMKGDGTLNPKYKNVTIEFPNIGYNKGRTDYNCRPYDFCFLFDAQNTEGKKLNSFDQYLDHAASCIFAQSIGPMNARSNSSEDNIIREIASKRGRNRYAGAGSSLMIYPTDDVKEYVATKWTQQNISNIWLQFDKMFFAKREKNKEMIEKGLITKDPDRSLDYIDAIDQQAKSGNAFAKMVKNQCSIFDVSGTEIKGVKYKEYKKHLDEEIIQQIENSAKTLNNQKENARNRLADVCGGSDAFSQLREAYNETDKYYKMVCNRVDDLAANIAFTLFKIESGNILRDKAKFRLESYLRDQEECFIHPNAVRYFLYQVYQIFKNEITQTKETITEIETFFNEEVPGSIDDPKTPDVVETIDQLPNRSVTFTDKIKILMGRKTNVQLDLEDCFAQMLDSADDLLLAKTKLFVYQEGLEYVQSLNKAFENFYDNFAIKVNGMNKRLATINKKYENCEGKTVRYVCATKECMDKLSDTLSFKGSIIKVDNNLAEEIYSKVRQYANLKEKPQNAFAAIFEEGIIGYYSKSVMEQYGSQIDMDILSALEKEIELLTGETDPTIVNAKMEDFIEESRTLANPFIEKPNSKEDDLQACAFSPELNPKDDSPRTSFVQHNLIDKGGTASEDIEPNMIMFYKAVYGLEAKNLSKFARASSEHTEGEYFSSYYHTINEISPRSEWSKVITPHIDKRWHLTSQLPDIDDSEEKEGLGATPEETKIYKAFLNALVYGMIDCTITPMRTLLYSLRLTSRSGQEMVVEDGSACNEFYKALNAITINPPFVKDILVETETLINQEISNTYALDTNSFKNRLNRLNLIQYPQFESISIFDIMLLLVISTPQNDFKEPYLEICFKVFLAYLEEYISRMVSGSYREIEFGKLIVEQFTKFTNNFEKYQALYDARNKDIVRNYHQNQTFNDFVSELERITTDNLQQKNLSQERNEIEKLYQKIKPVLTI